MKNTYFMLKAFFVLKILTFLYWFLDYVKKKTLIIKLRLMTKFMTSQTKHMNTKHLLPNISKVKVVTQCNLIR